jgi:phenylacetate-CoA ligase
MLIVRGVNLYPTAIRGVLADFRPQVAETFRIRPRTPGVAQQPPLPIVVELGPTITTEPEGLRQQLIDEIRTRLLVNADVQLVPYGSLPRDTYKSRLVEYPPADTPPAAH